MFSRVILSAGLMLGTAAVGGCLSERSNVIPQSAQLRVEGDKLLTYNAAQDGMVYVFNRNANEVVYSGQINRNQSITVDPEKNQILLDGRMVSENTLRNGDRYRIFFQPASGSMSTGSSNTL